MIPQYWSEATRHEDAYQSGIADVSFVQRVKYADQDIDSGKGIHGWIELKFKGMAPIRTSTVCRLDHFTDDQRRWLKAKGEAGGMTFLLLQLGRSWLLFDHLRCQFVGKVTSAKLYELANYHSDGLNPRELWSAINESG